MSVSLSPPCGSASLLGKNADGIKVPSFAVRVLLGQQDLARFIRVLLSLTGECCDQSVLVLCLLLVLPVTSGSV